MKITVHVAGGLANKMFHCAAAIALKKQGNEVAIDDESEAIEFEHDRLSLQAIFPHLDLARMERGSYKHAGKTSLYSKLMRRLPFIAGEKYYISHCFNYDEAFIGSIKRDSYIICPFQNEKYFEKAVDEVRSAFSFPTIEDEKNIELIKKLEAENSVSIHVRKGDGYATWPEFVGTCPLEYYKKAVSKLQSIEANLKFYVFTDSPDWVRENFGWFDYTLVDWNPCVGWGNHFDMQLMTHCKHNIIANSTYSWWGAWLNPNPGKVVIAPAEWFKLCSKVKEQSDIVPLSWIRL